ncbi:MAG: DNA topoisomerase I, partial [Gemmatimonadetes bacterium]|nr:DNA topoisomerase I [Gemmatimonadota bacterium]
DKIYLLDGQYGPYVQLGEGEGKQKPKRSSLPKGVKPEDVTLDLAVGLLSLPRVLGTHPDTGNTVKAGLGRFGPFVVHAKGGTEGKDDFRSLKAGDDVLTVTLDRALELLREPKGIRGQRAAATPLRTIGSHPKDGEPVHLFDGRYGPYVKHGDLNASLPKGADPQAFTLDEAVRLIAEKGKPPKGKRRSAKASTARTSTAKKSTAKKSTSRKTTKRAKKSTKRSST